VKLNPIGQSFDLQVNCPFARNGSNHDTCHSLKHDVCHGWISANFMGQIMTRVTSNGRRVLVSCSQGEREISWEQEVRPGERLTAERTQLRHIQRGAPCRRWLTQENPAQATKAHARRR